MSLKKIIQDIANRNEEIYSKVCKVISVNRDKRTCDVRPINDEEDLIYGVRLQADMEIDEGYVIFPAVNSNVVVTFINKMTGYVGLCSKIDEIQLNGDQFGGLIKIERLTDELNKTKAVLNAIKNVLTTWTPVPNDGGAALKTAATTALSSLNTGNYTNLTNDTVKHG